MVLVGDDVGAGAGAVDGDVAVDELAVLGAGACGVQADRDVGAGACGGVAGPAGELKWRGVVEGGVDGRRDLTVG